MNETIKSCVAYARSSNLYFDYGQAIEALCIAFETLNGNEDNAASQSVLNYAELNAIVADSLKQIWKRRCDKVLREMEKERPELKKRRIAWEKSHPRTKH